MCGTQIPNRFSARLFAPFSSRRWGSVGFGWGIEVRRCSATFRDEDDRGSVHESMEYGIQRRTVYLRPLQSEDLSWMFHQFDVDEVWQMFGMSGPSRLRIMRSYRTGNLVVGMMNRVRDRARIGFVVMFPPTGDFDFWEYGYAIPDHRHRDAWTAFNTCDAMAHYMFEHLRVEALGWRTREDNRAADAIVRRLGYKPFDSWVVDGHRYTFYRLDQATWADRRARLDRSEATHPSGQGDTFVTLLEPPFDPVPLAGTKPSAIDATDSADSTGASPRDDSSSTG